MEKEEGQGDSSFPSGFACSNKEVRLGSAQESVGNNDEIVR
jgi:hypothetical protein